MRDNTADPLIAAREWQLDREGGTLGKPLPDNLTTMLAGWGGTAEQREQAVAAVYAELRRIAAAYIRRERSRDSLAPTQLVHDAYLRLANHPAAAWTSRAQFFGIAARVMRQILVDRARRRLAIKRAAVRSDEPISQIADPDRPGNVDVLALHEALEELATLDQRQAEIVELRYFGGLTEAEVAALIGVSPVTVRREIASARAWLGHRLA
jgi:RNA polymerase sigma factor (TIGR02999 family)